jgi:serine/threonine kinase 16
MKEVEAYALFSPHPNIIRAIDHCISSDRSDPSAKTVYILLPYYRRGNLQDIINANLVNHTKFPEKRLMVLFLGVCRALKAMHEYRVDRASGATKKAKRLRAEALVADEEAEEAASSGRRGGKQKDVDSEQQEPLMDGEVTQSQVGVAPGEIRAYAHRDIKPGKPHFIRGEGDKSNIPKAIS